MKSLEALRSHLRSDSSASPDAVGRGLGWFSIALGVAELAIPRTLSRLIGANPKGLAPSLVRLAGLRELGVGLSILTQPNRPLPVWLRAAGDLMDLGMLGLAATSEKSSGLRLAGTALAVGGVAAVDVMAALRTQAAYDAANHPVVASVTIAKSPLEVYEFFRQLGRLPEFMDWLESVEETDSTHSTWTARLPVAGTVSWTAEITEERPGELLAWKSSDDAPLRIEGRVTFAEAPGRGGKATELRCEMKLGMFGHAHATLAALFAEPQVKGDLRRLKQVMETGEVLYSDASQHRLPHPAQPSLSPPEPKRELEFIPTEGTAQKGQLGPTDAGIHSRPTAPAQGGAVRAKGDVQ